MGEHFSYTKEQKEARSIRMKKLWQDPSYKAKMSEKLSAVVKTDEWRANMSLASKDRPKSDEHKHSMKISHLIRAGAIRLIRIDKPELSWREATIEYMTDKEHYRKAYLDKLDTSKYL